MAIRKALGKAGRIVKGALTKKKKGGKRKLTSTAKVAGGGVAAGVGLGLYDRKQQRKRPVKSGREMGRSDKAQGYSRPEWARSKRSPLKKKARRR